MLYSHLYRYRQSGNTSDWESSYIRMEKLDKYHGQASGVFGCDEHLAGSMPWRSVEGRMPLRAKNIYFKVYNIQKYKSSNILY